MKKVCMVVQNPMVKGGIAAVVNGYRGSQLERDYKIIYVESYKDGSKVEKLLKGISGYVHFAKVLLIDHPDIIHIHSSFGPSFYRKMPFIYMASLFKKPIINHIHGADFEDFYVRASQKKKNLIRRVYGKCTRLIALSDEWKEKLSQIVEPEKIEVIENYSIIHRDAVDERINRKSNDTVLFLGELGRRKGCFDIPDVAEKVIREVPDAEFILGGDGAEADKILLKKKFREKGIMNHIKFPGWVRNEEKDALLREADVYFLPSYNEGMPMSILDAMGYGLPIVSTDVGGIPKLVINGKNGKCCRTGDIEAMSESIVELLNNKEWREDAARENVSIIDKQYSLYEHIRRLEALYCVCLYGTDGEKQSKQIFE